MLSMRSWLALSLIGATIVTLAGCGDDPAPPGPDVTPIDPASQPDELCRALAISGANSEGAPPPASSGAAPQFIAVQASASVTADNTLYLPFGYSSSVEIIGLYISVAGAQNYWDVDLAGAGTRGTKVIPIGIPAEVLPGDFELTYQLHDAAGSVSTAGVLPTSVVPSAAGNGGPITFARVEGSDGLTVRTYALGSSSGRVSLAWETYDVPDRIDIRAGGKWVKSTGTLLDQLGAPPILDCSDAASADGFVGRSGTFSFDLDPTLPGIVDIYVSGCMNGGTAWYFELSFVPTETDSPLPACPCTLGEIALDVVDAAGGRWVDETALTLQNYHPGASRDIRWVPPANSSDRRGQQCTYDENGRLITSGLGAGTLDQVSPGVDMLGHYASDVRPWSTRSCVEYYAEWPTDNRNGCLDNPRAPFAHMAVMTRDMPCPEIRDFIGVIRDSRFATPALRNYVLGSSGPPSAETIRRDLLTIIENESSAHGYLRPVVHAYRNMGGQ